MTWESLFPAHITAKLITGAVDSSSLPQEEQALTFKFSSAKRKAEFIRGRCAAHAALRALGDFDNSAILRGDRGQPVWPKNIIGSISHTGKTALAAVCLSNQCRALGVDIQEFVLDNNRYDVSERVCHPSELNWIEQVEEPERTKRILALFSAKEALFKALFPITGCYFGFKDASLEWDPENLHFSATLLKDLSAEFPSGFVCNIQSICENRMLLSFVVV